MLSGLTGISPGDMTLLTLSKVATNEDAAILAFWDVSFIGAQG
jgi:hypothetical protein